MKWVNVLDSFPDKDEYVLCYSPDVKDKGPQMWIAQFSGGVFYSKSSGFFGDRVITHWMKLPNTPDTKEFTYKDLII